MDEKSDTKIPIASVKAKPFTGPPPNWNNTTAVNKDEILESFIEDQARSKPNLIARLFGLPHKTSSFIRSKIRTFASTAIPIEIINPANWARYQKICQY